MNDRPCPNHGVTHCRSDLCKRELWARERWEVLQKLVGLDWRPFSREDWYAWAGASYDAHIATEGPYTYIRSTEGNEITIEKYDDRELDMEDAFIWTWRIKG